MKMAERKELMAQVIKIVQGANVQNKEALINFVQSLDEDIDKKIAAFARDTKKRKDFSAAIAKGVEETISKTEFISADEIAEILSEQLGKEITKNMVSSRVGKLVKANKVEKKTYTKGGVRRTAYRYI